MYVLLRKNYGEKNNLNKEINMAKKNEIWRKSSIIRFIIEIIAAALITIFVELAFNYHALTAGYEPVMISENTITSKGKLIYQKELEEPVYIKKLILQGTADKKNTYHIKIVTVNDFGKEKEVKLKDSMYPELDAAFTNINQKVKQIQITFNHPSKIHLTSISYSNEVNFNKIRMFFFWLVSFLGILILFEKRLLLRNIWAIYLIAALGFGSILAVTSGAYAVTWDEEVHYSTVHNTGFSSTIQLNSAVAFNFSRNSWTSANTAEEQCMMKNYLDEEAKKDAGSYEVPRGIKNYITHFPMILAYHFGEKIGLSYTDNYILGRMGNLIFCAAITAFAIFIAHRKKILIAVVGIMPTVIFQSSMYTYDGVCFSCITLGVVLCVNELERKKETRKVRNLVVSAAFIGMGCVAKPVYFPLMFLLVPCIWERVKPLLNSKRNRHICVLILGISILLIAGVATIKMKPLLYNMAEGNLNYLGDSRGGDTGVSGQLLNIAEHPLAFGKMLIQEIFSFDNFRNAGDEVENTTLVCNQMFLNLYILGTLKEVWALILLPLLLLIFLVEPQGEPRFIYKKRTFRGYCIVATVASVVLVWLAMYLTFSPIGEDCIQGVQARYFLPLFLPFAYALWGDRIQVKMTRTYYYQVSLGAGLLLCSECIYKFLIVGKAL